MAATTASERSNRDRTYSITELCREFKVTPRTLRFYEQKGLLAPARRGWTRLFSYRDRARLQLILRGKNPEHGTDRRSWSGTTAATMEP